MVSSKTRVLAWLTAWVVVGLVATAFLATSDGEKRSCYTKKEDVILMGIPSNSGGAVRAARTM